MFPGSITWQIEDTSRLNQACTPAINCHTIAVQQEMRHMCGVFVWAYDVACQLRVASQINGLT